jgi:hypothetical protein
MLFARKEGRENTISRNKPYALFIFGASVVCVTTISPGIMQLAIAAAYMLPKNYIGTRIKPRIRGRFLVTTRLSVTAGLNRPLLTL